METEKAAPQEKPDFCIHFPHAVHDLTLVLGTLHVTVGQVHCNLCAQHGEDPKVPANTLGEGILSSKAFGKIWKLQDLAMAHIYAFLSGIIMTFTWKIEKPCKYSNWKKCKENYSPSLHRSVVPRGDGAEPLWLQVETVSLSSSQHLLSCSGLTPTKENSNSSVCTLKLCPWKNHRSTPLQDHEMLHHILHWGLQGKVQVLLLSIHIWGRIFSWWILGFSQQFPEGKRKTL